MTATVDKGTKGFTRVFLQESFRGGRIEAVADLIDRFEVHSPFGDFISISAYAKPQFGRIVLGMTPGGNPFLSDPCWHCLCYSIHRDVKDGDLVPADKFVSNTSSRPAITPDSHRALFGEVASAFGIAIV